ncbi:hypothetical protein BVI434_750002 [Burkholderia vietnamiensis]|nr:hypothetical protein BVI434_750002 [Burkholderia vietnamiensis]
MVCMLAPVGSASRSPTSTPPATRPPGRHRPRSNSRDRIRAVAVRALGAARAHPHEQHDRADERNERDQHKPAGAARIVQAAHGDREAGQHQRKRRERDDDHQQHRHRARVLGGRGDHLTDDRHDAREQREIPVFRAARPAVEFCVLIECGTHGFTEIHFIALSFYIVDPGNNEGIINIKFRALHLFSRLAQCPPHLPRRRSGTTASRVPRRAYNRRAARRITET